MRIGTIIVAVLFSFAARGPACARDADPAATLRSLNSLARQSMEAGRWSEADAHLQEAEAVAGTGGHGASSREVSETRLARAQWLLLLRRPVQAESLARQARSARLQEPAERATADITLAMALHQQSSLEESHRLLMAAVVDLEGDASRALDLGRAVLALALVSDDLGEQDQAARLIARRKAIDAATLPAGHARRAEAFNAEGPMLARRNFAAKARAAFEAALQIYEGQPGGGGLQASLARVGLASSLRSLGLLAMAADELQRAYEVQREHLGEDHVLVAQTLLEIGRLQWIARRYASAAGAFEAAVAILRRHLGGHPDTALAITQLAEIERQLGRHERVLPLLREASAILAGRRLEGLSERTSAREARTAALGLSRHVQMLGLDNRFAADSDARDEAFRIAQFASYRGTAATMAKVAERFSLSGDGLGALVRRQQDLAREREGVESELLGWIAAGGREPSARRRTQELGSRLVALDRDLEDIRSRLQDSFPGYKALTETPALGIAQVQSLLAEDEALVFYFLPRLPRAVAVRVEGEVTVGPGASRRTLHVDDEVGSGEFVSTAGDSYATIRLEDGTTLRLHPKSLAQVKGTSYASIARPGRFAVLNHRGVSPDITNKLAALPAARDETVVTDRNRGVPADRLTASRTQAAAVQDPDETGWVWVVRHRSAWAIPIAGTAVINRVVARMRDKLDPASLDMREYTLDTRPFFAAYEAIYKPIENALAGARHLVVVPDGALGSLPFHALLASSPSERASPLQMREADWLLRRHSFSYLPSVGTLAALRMLKSRVPGREPFAGFGNPDFEDHTQGNRGYAVPRPADVFRASRGTARTRLADVGMLRKLAPLPETETELRAMARYFGGAPDSLWLGRRATERAVKSTDLARFEVIAFATHGAVAGEVSTLGEPGLVLSPPLVATAEDDGYLAASEVAQLQLNADWVLLSACSTAAPEGEQSTEAFSGLAKSFLYAGARSLLVSHWSVDSEATVELTTETMRLYRERPGLDKAEAHRLSMLRLMTLRPRFAHPFFWAPFVVVGQS